MVIYLVMNDKILVCGGEDSKSLLLDLIQQYDPVKDEWSRYGTLPRPLRGRYLFTANIILNL